MRIGMFADMYKPYTSGVTVWIDVHKRRLERLGHEVFVFTFGDREHVDDEPGVIRSPGLDIGDTGANLALGFSERARELFDTLDVAHVHHPFRSGRLVVKHVRPLGVPVVFTNHTRYDLYSDVYASFVPKGIRHWWIARSLRELTADVDLVLSPSESIRHWLLEDMGVEARVEVQPNAVDTEPFREPGHAMRKSDLGIENDAVLACYLGRLGEEKRLDALFDRYLEVTGRSRRAALVLVGEGPLRERLEKRAREGGAAWCTEFTGPVPHDRVPGHLASADLFVSTSMSEAHPLTVLEAMAAGLPPVVCDGPGMRDTVTDGVDGRVVAPDDRTAFVEAWVGLVRDADERARMSAAAAETAVAYDIRPVTDRLVERYESLTSSG